MRHARLEKRHNKEEAALTHAMNPRAAEAAYKFPSRKIWPHHERGHYQTKNRNPEGGGEEDKAEVFIPPDSSSTKVLENTVTSVLALKYSHKD
ncbi:hypothetical protein RRG08_034089 [Elysia crispata]|uniref:Uncharacterized protein n=1 Tax=Elysia crispata TaxID=231223 RepID=A0AAE1D3V7_9GAST|nr:hypothetical protein RRG08_034089 [Elysia crispata]